MMQKWITEAWKCYLTLCLLDFINDIFLLNVRWVLSVGGGRGRGGHISEEGS